MIYLDSAATTKIDPQVLGAMLPYLTNEYGNAGSAHSLGRQASKALENAREQVARFLSCKPEQVIFTSGGSEGNNLVLRGLAPHLQKIGKTSIVTSMGEHDSVIRTVEDIGIKLQFHTQFLPISTGGKVDEREFSRTRPADCGLVSVMYVNNELGTTNPIVEISDICKHYDILFHTDCVQAACTYDLNVGDLGCDFLTISSHKIHGPKGVGAIFAKDPTLLSPIISGGQFQEFGLRGGTENVAGIVGFGKACEIMQTNMRDIETHIEGVKQKFFTVLMESLKAHGLENAMHVNGDPIIHKGKIINLRFDRIDGEALLLMLDLKGVYASAGSACHGHGSEPSRVLLAAGLGEEAAMNSIRVSFSKDVTMDDAENAGQIMASCVAALNSF